jgi:hypothetical protein
LKVFTTSRTVKRYYEYPYGESYAALLSITWLATDRAGLLSLAASHTSGNMAALVEERVFLVLEADDTQRVVGVVFHGRFLLGLRRAGGRGSTGWLEGLTGVVEALTALTLEDSRTNSPWEMRSVKRNREESEGRDRGRNRRGRAKEEERGHTLQDVRRDSALHRHRR